MNRHFEFDPTSIDYLILSHAHIDHSGLLPRLAMLGYKGPIYATPATIDLLEVLLPDSAFIQEKEAEWQLRHRHRRGQVERGIPAPLYSVAQALDARFGNSVPRILLHAAICRRELAVEIDGVHA